MNYRASIRWKKVGIFLLLFALTLIFIFPIYWIVTMSLKYKQDILVTVPQYIPKRLTLKNYAEVLMNSRYMTFLQNSILISVVTTTICVIIAAMAGFALTRFSFKGKSAISKGIFIIRMVPGLVYTVPLYMLYQKYGLIDTHWGLILAYCTFSLPMSVWLFLSFYEEVPREIYESGMVDGCNEYRLFIAIALPLVVPSISVVAILCFIGAWNEFGLALTLTFKDAYKTLPISINSMIQRDKDTPWARWR